MKENYDVIIVGTGAAGLYCALNLPSRMKVLMLTKQQADQSDSFWHRAVSACSEEKKIIMITLKIPCARAITKMTQKQSS